MPAGRSGRLVVARVAPAGRLSGIGWPTSRVSALMSWARRRCCWASTARAPSTSEIACCRSSLETTPFSKRSLVRRSDSSRVFRSAGSAPAVPRRPAGPGRCWPPVAIRLICAALRASSVARILRQRRIGQVAHAAEQVELEGRDRQAGLVDAGDRGVAGVEAVGGEDGVDRRKRSARWIWKARAPARCSGSTRAGRGCSPAPARSAAAGGVGEEALPGRCWPALHSPPGCRCADDTAFHGREGRRPPARPDARTSAPGSTQPLSQGHRQGQGSRTFFIFFIRFFPR
jgi:hypothetical protein